MTRIDSVSARETQRGFTIVELMIALAIAMLIVAAMSLLYLANQKTARVDDSLARRQESLRFAVEAMSYDLRMAGHYGCSFATIPVSHVSSTDENLIYSNLIRGYTGGSTPLSGVSQSELFRTTSGAPQDHPYSDVVRVQFASSAFWPVNTAMADNKAELSVDGNSTDFAVGNVLVVADCERGDLFVATAVAGSGVSATISHGAGGGNTGASFSKAYDTSAEVMRFVNRIYYVGKLNGRPVLMRKTLSAAPLAGTSLDTEEVADGIAEMQILYGEDTDADEAPNIYRKANTVVNWNNVVSAQVCLLYESAEDLAEKTTATGYQSYTNCAGSKVVATDKRLRQSVYFAVTLRNRVP